MQPPGLQEHRLIYLNGRIVRRNAPERRPKKIVFLSLARRRLSHKRASAIILKNVHPAGNHASPCSRPSTACSGGGQSPTLLVDTLLQGGGAAVSTAPSEGPAPHERLEGLAAPRQGKRPSTSRRSAAPRRITRRPYTGAFHARSRDGYFARPLPRGEKRAATSRDAFSFNVKGDRAKPLPRATAVLKIRDSLFLPDVYRFPPPHLRFLPRASAYTARPRRPCSGEVDSPKCSTWTVDEATGFLPRRLRRHPAKCSKPCERVGLGYIHVGPSRRPTLCSGRRAQRPSSSPRSFFEAREPAARPFYILDSRPTGLPFPRLSQKALGVLHELVKTGQFRVVVIRAQSRSNQDRRLIVDSRPRRRRRPGGGDRRGRPTPPEPVVKKRSSTGAFF